MTTTSTRARLARSAIAAGAALCLLAHPASAQLPWESPHLLSPGAPPGAGLHVVDWGLGPGYGVGVLLTWRGGTAPGGIGLRGGAARGLADNVIVAGGADLALPVLHASETFPVDVIWTSGAGASWGDYLEVAVPVGFAAGRSFTTGALWLSPHVSTRGVFEAGFGDLRPRDQYRLGLAIDVGSDVAFDRGQDFVLRVAASLGDRHALLAGVHVRM